MKILFIQDNAINESLALTDLSGLLKSNNHDCRLLLQKEEKNLLEKIEKFSPDLILIPFGILAHNFALNLAKEIKQNFSIPIVFAGSHPTFYPEIINSPHVDIVCIGEAEYPITNLVDAIESGKDVKKIKGLWVKENGRIHKNPLGPFVENLDELPLPDRELYYDYKFIRDLPMKRFVSGRGCIHSCGYCFNPILRGQYKKMHPGKNYTRKKSVNRMIEEIKYIKERYPLESVHFSDDLFTFDKKWVKEFCAAYKKEVGLPFTFNTTANQIDEQTVQSVSKANCFGIAIGIETGNENLRKLVLGKNITNEQIIKASGIIKKSGIKLATFNMIANPGETIEDSLLTMEINQKISADNPRITISHPIPKTALYDYSVDRGYLNDKEFQKTADKEHIKPYTKPFYKSKDMDEFENLFYLFRLGCKHPELTFIIEKLIKLPKNKLFKLGSLLFAWDEKNFFKIPLIDGLIYYNHCGNPFLRTTNYTSIV
jgi:radical SAM superfamily enzyme YgiQ (UPF0313 family)